MTYHLYITNKNYSSWSLRPWLLMKVLQIPFTEHIEYLIPGSYRQPQWKAFSPTAHVPCLHDIPSENKTSQDEPMPIPIILWESLSIIEHLADLHPDLGIYPATSKPAARAWARSAVAEMHASFSALRNEMGMNIGLRLRLLSPSTALISDLQRINELWSEGLNKFGGPYLAGGSFTAVDAFYAPVVLRLQTYQGSMEYITDEKVREYIQRILDLPELKEWVEDALKETAREPVHEAECLEGKELLEDLRAVAA
ncbi:hypothetical protein V8F20_010082 [Naviculisporaceae sp. PSN 640]